MMRSPKVLMMPDYRPDNPYQSLLATNLERQSITVLFASGYRRGLPLGRAVRQHQAQILHLHWLTPYLKGESWLTRGFYSLKLWLDLWLIRLGGTAIIWTIHNDLSHDAQFPGWEQWLRTRLKQLVAQTIVHQQPKATGLGARLPASQIIPHGHYRDVYAPALEQQVARQQLNLSQDGLLYLNLGMIRPYKGLENLLAVWQEHQDCFAKHHLLIAGQPEDANYAAKITALAAPVDHVIFQSGYVPLEQIPLYFSAADLVVLPFEQILTSGSLILAMSYAKPIIAPRYPGIFEVLPGATELLYDPGDHLGLVKAIKLSTELDLELLSRKVKLACDRLDWSEIAQQTAQVYQTCLVPSVLNSSS